MKIKKQDLRILRAILRELRTYGLISPQFFLSTKNKKWVQFHLKNRVVNFHARSWPELVSVLADVCDLCNLLKKEEN